MPPTTFHSFLSSLILLLLWPHFVFAVKERNVTVDDNDGSITYSPANGGWGPSAKSDLDFGGTHMLSDNAAATATFKFTGTAVYMLSPKWPYDVNTVVSLDGGQSTTVDLVDHSRPSSTSPNETVMYGVVWGQTGLSNTSHTLVLSRANTYVVVDGFIYTQSFPDDAVVSSTSAQSSARSTGTSASSSPTSSAAASNSGGAKKSNTVAIACGVVFGALAVLAAIAFFLLWRRRQERKAAAVPTGSSWEKNAFAPQLMSGGPSPSPGASSPWVAGHSPNTHPGPTEGYSNAPLASAHSDYGGYNSAGAAAPGGAFGVGGTAAAAAALATNHAGNVPSQPNHPYGYAGATSAYPQRVGYDNHTDSQPRPLSYETDSSFNPYLTAGPLVVANPTASSSQTNLRPQNTNSDIRESNTLSGASSQLAYTSAAPSEAGGSSSNGTSQPRYMTSQQEKEQLYRHHAGQTPRPAPSPPAYSS